MPPQKVNKELEYCKLFLYNHFEKMIAFYSYKKE